jgi:uncharacterized membrane protein
MAFLNLPDSKLDRAFIIAIYLKALVGFVELVGGIGLLFVRQVQINYAAQFLAARVRDKDDWLTRVLANYFGHLASGTIRFAAIYIIVDSLIKLVLIYEILHKRYWAYIGLIVVLSVLVVYQTYRITITHSIPLLALTLFDVLVIILSAKEWLRHQKEPQPAESN